jgi:hypothetical protein
VTSPIRTSPFVPPAATGQAAPAARAAQRAFFEAALGKATSPAQIMAQAVGQQPAQPARVKAAPTEMPDKVLRPGSLVNVLV